MSKADRVVQNLISFRYEDVFNIYFRTYAKLYAVGAIHELPLPENKGFVYCLRKFCIY